MQLLVTLAVFVDEPGDFYVEAAILRDFREPAVLEPADGLQALRCFLDAEGRRRNRVEREPVVQFVLQFHHHVERRQLAQIERRVAVQHLVIEPQIVEADDEIGALQIRDEVVHLLLAVNFVIAARGAERDADAHAHF